MSEYKFGDKVTHDGQKAVVASAGEGLGRQRVVMLIVGEGSIVGPVPMNDPSLSQGWRIPEGFVKVRAAVAVDDESWAVQGFSRWEDDQAKDYALEDMNPCVAVHFITALVPLPRVEEIEGEIE